MIHLVRDLAFKVLDIGGKIKSVNVSPNNRDNFMSTTGSSTMSGWRGKNDRFTGGFMNLMYQDNSLQSVVR